MFDLNLLVFSKPRNNLKDTKPIELENVFFITYFKLISLATFYVSKRYFVSIYQ